MLVLAFAVSGLSAEVQAQRTPIAERKAEPELKKIVNLEIYSYYLMVQREKTGFWPKILRIGNPERKLRLAFSGPINIGQAQLDVERRAFQHIFGKPSLQSVIFGKGSWNRPGTLRLKFQKRATLGRKHWTGGKISRFSNTVWLSPNALDEARDWAIQKAYGNVPRFLAQQGEIFEIYNTVAAHSRRYGGKTVGDVLTDEQIRFLIASESANVLFKMIVDFIVAHEAGHYFLRHYHIRDCDQFRAQERAADAFAVVHHVYIGRSALVRDVGGFSGLASFQARFSDAHIIGNAKAVCGYDSKRERSANLVSVYNKAVAYFRAARR
ncbi:hypothetical protein JCR33_21450 [Acuticoccus sp. 2012]|uniref:Uncharacterized protein n=1 Tax=Acuticoccus mangrovi TaxID=2796142 RepID=A0A934IKE7_9HYPH|nr:hypothetical protein [Acuticoccus mangrovi]